MKQESALPYVSIRNARLLKSGVYWVLFVGIFLVLPGCGVSIPESPSSQVEPTLNPGFNPNQGNGSSDSGESAGTVVAVPTISDLFVIHDSSTDQSTPTNDPSPTPENAAPVEPLELFETKIYSEGLNPNWNILATLGVDFDPMSSDFPFDGEVSIEVTPTVDFGRLMFVVRPESEETYLRDQVFGFSFWLYSGDGYVATSDISVTVFGSNALPFWRANDNSVKDLDTQPFSETRFYFLDINRDIPPETWVRIDVWLDNLIFEPDYEFVTGLYIKNDAGFNRTVYVDDVKIFLLQE